jgi:hypothetical protein
MMDGGVSVKVVGKTTLVEFEPGVWDTIGAFLSGSLLIAGQQKERPMTSQVIADRDELQLLLRRSEVSEIRAVELNRIGKKVVLRGIVGSFYYKQLAQELVRTGAKGLEIENQICVEYIEASVTPDW